ncbi:MAG: BMP family ABC transporter substrate-binding protein [Spirochaetes bacterium]|nr:BMP family ABC transporter substrate-binding protein [Spirochaetota bacterium]
MKKNRAYIMAFLILIIPCLVYAGAEKAGRTSTVFSIGLVLGAGGLGDKGFNDSAYEGIERASQKLGIRYDVLEFLGEAQSAHLKGFVQEGLDLIIVIGWENIGPLREAAQQFPNQRFAYLEEVVEAPNITSVVFRELEGDFLAGALCALLSQSGKVGYLGGADVPVIRRIEHGFVQGVRYINPDAVIISRLAGGKNDFTGFGRPELGRTLAVQMYDEGADILYCAAGKTGLGAIEAAEAKDKLIVMTSTDQRWISPEHVMSSRTKNMGTAAYMLVERLIKGELKTETIELDLATGGVGLAPLESDRIPNSVKKRMPQLEKDLIKGKIKVEEYVRE